MINSKYNEKLYPSLLFISKYEINANQKVIKYLAEFFNLSDEYVTLRTPNNRITYLLKVLFVECLIEFSIGFSNLKLNDTKQINQNCFDF